MRFSLTELSWIVIVTLDRHFLLHLAVRFFYTGVKYDATELFSSSPQKNIDKYFLLVVVSCCFHVHGIQLRGVFVMNG